VRTLASDRFGLDVQVHAAMLSHLDVQEQLAGPNIHQVLASCLPGYEVHPELPERIFHRFEDDGEVWGQYRRSLVLAPWSELSSGLPTVVFGYQPVDPSASFLKVGMFSSIVQLLDLDICDEILRLVTEVLCQDILDKLVLPEELFRLTYLEAAYDQPVHWLRYADAHATTSAPGVQDHNIALNLHRGACTYGQRGGHRQAASYLKHEDGIVLLRRECRMRAHQLHERLGIGNNRQLRNADGSRLFHLQLGGPVQQRVQMRMAEYRAQFHQPVPKPLVATARSWASGGAEPPTVVVRSESVVGDLTELIDARHLATVLPWDLAQDLAAGKLVFPNSKRAQLVAAEPGVCHLLADVVQVDGYAIDPQRVRRQLGELLLQLPTLVYRLRAVIVSTDDDPVRLAAVALLDGIQQLHRALRVWIIEQLNATHTRLTHNEFARQQQLATDHILPHVAQWQALLATRPHPPVAPPGSTSTASPTSPTPPAQTASTAATTSPPQSAQPLPATPPSPAPRRQWQTGPAYLARELTAAKLWNVPGVDDVLVEIAPLSFTRTQLVEIVRRAWARSEDGSVELAAAFLALVACVKAGKTRSWREHEDELSAIKRAVQPWVPRPREVEERGRFLWRHFPRQSVHLAIGVLVAQRLLSLADVHDIVCDRPDAVQPQPIPDELWPPGSMGVGCRSGPACAATQNRLGEPFGRLHAVVRPMPWMDPIATVSDRPGQAASRH